MAASGVTSGIYQDPDGGQSNVNATWSRSAGSPNGTVQLQFPDLGLTFKHVFHILEYDGTLSYSTVDKTITGQVSAARAGAADQTVSGEAKLAIAAGGALDLTAGSWKNQDGANMDFSPVGSLQQNGLTFQGFIAFSDGLLDTSAQDYILWSLEIISADANGNNVPDLVESSAPPPAQPTMAARHVPEGIEITVTGTNGAAYTLESVSALGTGAQWGTVQTVNMTSETVKVTLPIQSGNLFFRLKG